MDSDVIEKPEEDAQDQAAANAVHERFYFNQHIFDDGYVEEEEEPPAPTFSEEELESAKKSSFTEGKRSGSDEATKREQSSREQLVAQALNKISSTTSELFAEEEKRETRYQAEALNLTLDILDRVFPVLNQSLGFTNLTHQIEDILSKHKKTPLINVHVSPDNVTGITTFLDTLSAKGHNGSFHVFAGTNMDEAACRLDWPEGGAHFNTKDVAEEIRTILVQTLADAGITRHDEEASSLDDSSVDATETHDMQIQTSANEQQTTVSDDTIKDTNVEDQ